jgi:hypothetical protein
MLKFVVYLSLCSILHAFIPIHVIAAEQKDFNTLDKILKEAPYIKVGETTFSILFWDLYKSKLKTTSGTYPIQSANEKIIYQINYFADISSKDLIKRTVEQWQHLGVAPEEYQDYIILLEDIWPDIEDGDSLTLYVNNYSSAFYFNNDFVGEIEHPEFSQLFLDIWLSEKTSEPELRLELLGVNNNE